jgi:hypothetical protein
MLGCRSGDGTARPVNWLTARSVPLYNPRSQPSFRCVPWDKGAGAWLWTLTSFRVKFKNIWSFTSIPFVSSHRVVLFYMYLSVPLLHSNDVLSEIKSDFVKNTDTVFWWEQAGPRVLFCDISFVVWRCFHGVVIFSHRKYSPGPDSLHISTVSAWRALILHSSLSR